MLENSDSFSSFSVNDIRAARDYYHDKLGLDVDEVEMKEMPRAQWPLRLRLGNGHTVMLYEKPDHAPAGFTVLNFSVPDVEAAVSELGDRGIRTLHYEGDIETDANGIHRSHGVSIAWFTDPAGNVLAVIEEAH